MPPENWSQIKELLGEALEREPAERPAFLDGACGDDAALRAQLDQLIAAHDDDDDALIRATRQDAVALDLDAVEPPGPRTLGDFRILREVGRGGMGVVYEAEQVSLDRRVALKVLPFAAVLDPRQLQRFKNEAQAAASMHHTNILPVYAVGCERSVHFYAMQFVDGPTLGDVIAELRGREGLGFGVQSSEVRGQGSEKKGPLVRDSYLAPDSAGIPSCESDTHAAPGTQPTGERISTDLGPRKDFRPSDSSAQSATECAREESTMH